MPVVGERVQHQVDVVVAPQVLSPRLVRDERHAVGRDALLLQPLDGVAAEAGPRGRAGADASRSTARSTRAQSASTLGVDLDEVVQAAERDVTRWPAPAAELTAGSSLEGS